MTRVAAKRSWVSFDAVCIVVPVMWIAICCKMKAPQPRSNIKNVPRVRGLFDFVIASSKSHGREIQAQWFALLQGWSGVTAMSWAGPCSWGSRFACGRFRNVRHSIGRGGWRKQMHRVEKTWALRPEGKWVEPTSGKKRGVIFHLRQGRKVKSRSAKMCTDLVGPRLRRLRLPRRCRP